jgi:hypothetical protein
LRNVIVVVVNVQRLRCVGMSAAQRRVDFLNLLRVILLHSQWADRGYYRKDNICDALESIFSSAIKYPGRWFHAASAVLPLSRLLRRLSMLVWFAELRPAKDAAEVIFDECGPLLE